MDNSEKKDRYSLIDAIRAAAVVNMIIYHLCYDIFCVFGIYPAFNCAIGAVIWERAICCTFIIVSGVSLNFTSHGYRRGIILNLCGFAITVISVLLMPSQAIWFGVLNLLGCAMLIGFALRDLLMKISPVVGMAILGAIYALLYGVPYGYIGLFGYRLFSLPDWMYGCKYLAYIGLPSADFVSADYFPIIPWIFLYLFGFFLWRAITEKGWDKGFRRKIPVLDFIGRHSLLIYLAHQPLLYGACWLLLHK